MVVKSKHIVVEPGIMPKKPLGFMPFRLRQNFWDQTYTVELWRGNKYAQITSVDLYNVIKVSFIAWKRFA